MKGETRVRGADRRQHTMFGYVSLEARLPRNHPLRSVRTMVDDALCKVSRRFATLYAESGRPSIPPERARWRVQWPRV